MTYPAGLKSIVTAVFLFMQATGAGVVLLFLPLMHDPALVWPFALTVSGVSSLLLVRRDAIAAERIVQG